MGSYASERAAFTERLLERRLLLSTGVPGVFGRGPVLHDLVARIEALADTIARADGAERVQFPPVVPRELVRRVGYLDNFPHLCGSVHAFTGDDRAHAALVERVKQGGDWTDLLAQTEVVLAPAACYPLYPTLTGTLPEGGALYDLCGMCFRHEPSDDPARMQSFELRENVRVGRPGEVVAWRSAWLERGGALFESLGLPVRIEVASDPFFGRGGRLMRASQHELELKFEVLVPITSEEEPTAICSFNYHQDKFGRTFDIRTCDGATAHSACIGLGIDRIALALLGTHGLDPLAWPTAVRARLWP